MTMCNSWFLYKRIRAEKGCTNKTLNSADFRLEVAETLCKYKTTNRTKRGSDTECLMQNKKKCQAQHLPPKDIRLDQYGHWHVWLDKRMRCKLLTVILKHPAKNLELVCATIRKINVYLNEHLTTSN